MKKIIAVILFLPSIVWAWDYQQQDQQDRMFQQQQQEHYEQYQSDQQAQENRRIQIEEMAQRQQDEIHALEEQERLRTQQLYDEQKRSLDK